MRLEACTRIDNLAERHAVDRGQWDRRVHLVGSDDACIGVLVVESAAVRVEEGGPPCPSGEQNESEADGCGDGRGEHQPPAPLDDVGERDRSVVLTKDYKPEHLFADGGASAGFPVR